MKELNVLAIETSTTHGSIALINNEGATFEEHLEEGAQQGRLIAPVIDTLLRDQHLTPKDIDLIALGLGPGSYTGLRIGASLAKALSYGTGCKLVGVSSFSALAFAKGNEGDEIIVVAKAGRYDYSFALFCIESGMPVILTDHAIGFEEDIAPLITLNRKVLGEAAEEIIVGSPDVIPQASHVAALGKRIFLENGPTPEQDLLPLYLRRSTAEINWEKQNEKRNKK